MIKTKPPTTNKAVIAVDRAPKVTITLMGVPSGGIPSLGEMIELKHSAIF